MRALLAVIIFGTLVLAGCGDDDRAGESAEDALRRQLVYLADGQGEKAYEERHPAQQAILSREDYAACVDTIGPVDLMEVKVEKMVEQEITIAGTDEKATATVIDAELTIRSGVPATVETGTSTFREVMVDGEWRLTLYDPPICT